MAKKAKKAKKKTAKAAARKSAKKPVQKSVKKPAARRAAAKRKTATPASAKGGSTLQSVAPGLTTNDVERSIAWYCDVLGFAVKQRWEHEGKLLGAEMNCGGVTFNLGQDDWQKGRDRIKGAGMRMYITTGPKIDELADQIKARGGTLTQEPKDEWGMRTFSIDDPDGFRMTFLTILKP
jgi:uncharacterized glyoxalase superfamily protein PhnB